MAVQNTISVRIGDKKDQTKLVNYTRKAVFPLKIGRFLDEQLDECYLSLRHMKTKM